MSLNSSSLSNAQKSALVYLRASKGSTVRIIEGMKTPTKGTLHAMREKGVISYNGGLSARIK